jgi:hypothetical protein
MKDGTIVEFEPQHPRDYKRKFYLSQMLVYKASKCHATLPGGYECHVAPIAILKAIKVGHLHVAIDWKKHMQDLVAIQAKLSSDTTKSTYRER